MEYMYTHNYECACVIDIFIVVVIVKFISKYKDAILSKADKNMRTQKAI